MDQNKVDLTTESGLRMSVGMGGPLGGRLAAAGFAALLLNLAFFAPAANARDIEECANVAETDTKQVAMELSVQCDAQIAINSATTEFERLWALPNGGLRREISAAPRRVWKEEENDWVPIDLELVDQGDGTIVPRAHPKEIEFSSGNADGGMEELATMTSGDKEIAVAWEGMLPKPVIDRNAAVYRDVRPGVDLQVEATIDGLETSYIVKTPQAAEYVGELPVALTGPDINSHRVSGNGTITLLDEDEEAIASSPKPLMWDSRFDPKTGQPLVVRSVPTTITDRPAIDTSAGAETAEGPGVEIALTPSVNFFEDPATVYPVVVDPKVTYEDPSWDTWVRQGYTADLSTTTNLAIGMWGGAVDRAFVNFLVEELKGKHVASATTGFFNFVSSGCSDTAWELWNVTSSNTSTRWTSQPTWKTKEGTSTATKGGPSSCTAPGWVWINSTAFFQRHADEQRSVAYMGIKASNESDIGSGKQFYSQNFSDTSKSPITIVDYKEPPTLTQTSIATDNFGTMLSSACPSGASRTVVKTATPQVNARLAHPTDTTVAADFQISDLAGNVLGTESVAGVPIGQQVSAWISAPLQDGQSYKWRVRPREDGTSYAGEYSGWCEFTLLPIYTSSGSGLPNPQEGGEASSLSAPTADIPESTSSGNYIPGIYDGLPTAPEPDANASVDESLTDDSASGLDTNAVPIAETFDATGQMSSPPVELVSSPAPTCPTGYNPQTIGYSCTAVSAPRDSGIEANTVDAIVSEPQVSAYATSIGRLGSVPLPGDCRSAGIQKAVWGRFSECSADDYEHSFKSKVGNQVIWDGTVFYRVYRYARAGKKSGTWDFHVYITVTNVVRGQPGGVGIRTVRAGNQYSYCSDKNRRGAACTVQSRIHNKPMSNVGQSVEFYVTVNNLVSDGQRSFRHVIVPWHVYRAPDLIDDRSTTTSALVRCDRALPENKTTGCVMPNVLPALVYGSSEFPSLRRHIRAAWRLGLPGETPGGGRLAGWQGDDKKLTRLTRTELKNQNYRRACPSGLRLRAGAPAGTSCDEYPMQSTYQGAYTANYAKNEPQWFRFCNIKNPTDERLIGNGVGYSRCFINHDDNTRGGNKLGQFYSTGDAFGQRIIDQDGFFLKVQ